MRLKEKGLARAITGVFALSVLALATLPLTVGASGPSMPTDKMTVAGVALQRVDNDTLALSSTMRTSTTEDLAIHVSLECAILTRVVTVGNDTAQQEATVTVWVTIDGTPVPVGPGGDDG